MEYVQSRLGENRRRERRMQGFIVAVWPGFLTLLAGAYIAVDKVVYAVPIVAEPCFLIVSISSLVT